MIILSSTVVKERLTEQDVWGSIPDYTFFSFVVVLLWLLLFSHIFSFPFWNSLSGFLLLALSLSSARLSKSHMSRIKINNDLVYRQ